MKGVMITIEALVSAVIVMLAVSTFAMESYSSLGGESGASASSLSEQVQTQQIVYAFEDSHMSLAAAQGFLSSIGGNYVLLQSPQDANGIASRLVVIGNKVYGFGLMK
jgi:hypothetical protein